jgi:hypothetical protein
LVASAAPQSVRWTAKEDTHADLTHVLDVIRTKTGVALTASDFMKVEERDLANNHFTMYFQQTDGTPVKGQSLRIWNRLDTGATVQVEARVDQRPPLSWSANARAVRALSSEETSALVRAAIKKHGEDTELRNLTWQDFYDNGRKVRIVRAKAKHGEHRITLSVTAHKIVEQKYVEYPQADKRGGVGEQTIPVQVYPIYEAAEGTGNLQSRIASELRYVKTARPSTGSDPYAALRTQRYLASKYDPILGLTDTGRLQGFWSSVFLKFQALDILNKLPTVPNDYASGVILHGRYATVNLYADAAKAFPGLNFKPQISGVYRPVWVTASDVNDDELIPGATLLGRPLVSANDAWTRPARVLPDHDPKSYLEDGFDELQVYWAVTQMFDSLRPMGFTDPELSTRPFNAFLYDTDISYRDNAYYTDDTINFTTYSKENMARDNTTIWHELGHGVMDRLMGDFITLADTGGLSEGMADFVAQLVVNDVTNMQTFEGRENMRIFNNTGFNLTNEVHDDGEAYGGAMNDFLVAAMKKLGRAGLTKVTDVTLEAMRLSRNHPGLTANGWFEHMLFADELGNGTVRAPGELHDLIVNAVAKRNFNMDGSPVAKMTVMVGSDELTSSSPGARETPIKLKLGATETKSYDLTTALKSTASYQFRYPVTVKVLYTGGALEGSIHWEGEEAGPQVHVLKSEADLAKIHLTATGKCDAINRPDNSCVDYAYIQIWNDGETQKPAAKKRFYLRVYPQ